MKTSKYSVWARHFKAPLAKEGEDLFGAVYRIATSFVGKTLLRAYVANIGGVHKFREQKILIKRIYKIDLRGAEVKNGCTTTMYPNVQFVCGYDKNIGGDVVQDFLPFDADELYESRAMLDKDSKRMCGEYADRLSTIVGCIKWEAKQLSEHLRHYREIAKEFIGRGYATKRIWKNPKLDELVNHLMRLADDKIIAEVCND